MTFLKIYPILLPLQSGGIFIMVAYAYDWFGNRFGNLCGCIGFTVCCCWFYRAAQIIPHVIPLIPHVIPHADYNFE